MDLPAVTTELISNAAFWTTAAGGALVAGFSASGHCALMCGPLACVGVGSSSACRWRAAMAWNVGRLFAYTFVGALLGLVGQGLALSLFANVSRILPFVMAAGLVVAAFDLGRRLRLPRGLAQVAHGLFRSGARFAPLTGSVIAGAATPFLPCGVLWGGYLAAVGAGSFLGGGLVMGSFALGGIPALAAVQTQWTWMSRWPRAELYVRRGVPLLAAAVLVWRAVSAAAGPSASCH